MLFPLAFQEYPEEVASDEMGTDKMYTDTMLGTCSFHYYWDFGEFAKKWRRYLILSEFGYENGFACFGGYKEVYRENTETNNATAAYLQGLLETSEEIGKRKDLPNAKMLAEAVDSIRTGVQTLIQGTEDVGKGKKLQDAQFWVDAIRYLVVEKGIPLAGLYYKYPETEDRLSEQNIEVDELNVDTLLKLEPGVILIVRGNPELSQTTLITRERIERTGML